MESTIAEEVDIFAACMEWASAECERQKLEDNPENQRKVLGNHLHKIRFPTMTIQQFADIVVPTGILRDPEGFLIFQYFVCQTKPDVAPFKTDVRGVLKKKVSRLKVPGPYSSKYVNTSYQAGVDLYCLVSKEIKVRSLFLHDFARKGETYSKFEVRVIQEQEEKVCYTNGDKDTETLTIDGRVVSKIPMDITIKAGKFKIHIDHWVTKPKTASFAFGQSEYLLDFGESDKAFVAADKVVTLKIGSSKELPLFGLDYMLA